MASVTGTYARAFADVVIEQRLDPDKTLQQARLLVQLVASSKELREVFETPSIPAEQEIMAAAKLARRELKAFAADMAVTLAKKQIRVDPSTDQGLMRSFTEQLSANYSDGDRPKAGKG